MFRAALLACLLALPMALVAQTRTADSLAALLRAHPQQDTVRVDLLLKLVHQLEDPRPDTAIDVAREALRIARTRKDHTREAEVMREMSDLLVASFDSAYYYLRLAMAAARKANDPKLVGHVYDDLSYAHLSLTYAQATGARTGMLEQAVAYSDSAIGTFAANGDTIAQAYSLSRKAEVLMYLHREDEAGRCLQQALGFVRGTVDEISLAVQTLLAKYHLWLERPDSALFHQEVCLRISEQLGLRHQIAYNRTCIADELALLGQYDRALLIASEALVYARENGLVKETGDAVYTLYETNRRAGHLGEALKWHEQLLLTLDSTNAIMAQESMNKLQVALESAKNRERVTVLEKDRQINEQKRARQRTALFALGGGVLLLILLALVIQNRYRLKHRALKESEEQKAIIEKEKARSEELLLNILPHEVAEELKAKGSAEAVQIDQVTVLFTDFKGFTAMSEVVTPKQLVKDLHECFSAFDHICQKRGLEKIKTIGDSYMAAGGLPTPNTTHASDVIHAALEMRDFIAEGKAQKIAAGLPYFEIRIGIHTGPVVAGIVGVKKFQYDIWGDTVNTASRMESSGEVGQVNISEATYAVVREQAGRLFDYTPRGKVQAKGKGELEMFFVRYGSIGTGESFGGRTA